MDLILLVSLDNWKFVAKGKLRIVGKTEIRWKYMSMLEKYTFGEAEATSDV